jgi:glycine cleavage system H protein
VLRSTSDAKTQRLGSASLFIDPSNGDSFYYPTDRRYTKKGVWAKVKDGVATVGVSEAYLDSSAEMVFVNPAGKGTTRDVGDPVADLETTDDVGELASPVSGEIVDSNQQLEDDLTALKTDPYESGWIVRIRLDDPTQVDQMLSASDYVATLPDDQKPGSDLTPLRSPTPRPPTPLKSPTPPTPESVITDFEVVSGSTRDVGCPANMIKWPLDLNSGAGGKFVYLCVRWGTSDGLSGLAIAGPDTDDEGRLVPGKAPDGCDATDLNVGAGGYYLYLCSTGVSADPTEAINDLELDTPGDPATDDFCPADYGYSAVGPASQHSKTINTKGVVDTVNGDLNQGAGGRWIYICQLNQDTGNRPGETMPGR